MATSTYCHESVLCNDKMAKENCNGLSNSEEADDMERLLSIVVKRRKTLPTKIMDFYKRMAAVELFRLENSVILLEKDDTKDNFKRIIKELRNTKHVAFSLEDLEMAEAKLQKHFSKLKEVNDYLEKRKKLENKNKEDLQST